MICGHYMFSNEDFIRIKKEMVNFFNKKKIRIDDLLKREIKKSILRYMTGFRLVD